MIFIFIANIATNYNIAPFQDFDYQLHAEKFNISGQCDCVIPINPAGWSFKVPCTTLDAYSWNANGLVLDKQGEYDEALKAFNKAIELNPKYAEAWNNKGNALKSIGRTTETDAAFTRAKELGYKG
jgi:tetratricopeptide (TPR) repeat protein